ncbi:hypothetical protein niasHT_008540 [Heterodera trifolii]|uniref:Effector protein n=1 Tax=Heterodera trifolii TaxID=157864 RepID=A0ABD2M9X5_9BILA
MKFFFAFLSISMPLVDEALGGGIFSKLRSKSAEALSDSPSQQINYTAENNDESNGRRFLSDGGTVGHGKSCSKNKQKISRPILNTRRLEKGESSMSNYYDDSRRLLSAKNLSISTTSSSSSLAIIPFEQRKEQPDNDDNNNNKQREKATAEEKGKKVATLLDTKKRSKSFHSRFPPVTARDQGPPVGMIGFGNNYLCCCCCMNVFSAFKALTNCWINVASERISEERKIKIVALDEEEMEGELVEDGVDSVEVEVEEDELVELEEDELLVEIEVKVDVEENKVDELLASAGKCHGHFGICHCAGFWPLPPNGNIQKSIGGHKKER